MTMPTQTRVLVVDDDFAVQSSLKAYLEDMGYAVRSTGTATEALQILTDEPFDVAVVDVRLREMTGEDLIQRAHTARPAMRFLIYTGSLGYHLPESLAGIGITSSDVLYKPIRTLSLIANEIRRVSGKVDG